MEPVLLNCTARSFSPGFYWRFEPRGDNGRFTNPPDIVEVSEDRKGYYACGGDLFETDFEGYLFVGPLMPPNPQLYVAARKSDESTTSRPGS